MIAEISGSSFRLAPLVRDSLTQFSYTEICFEIARVDAPDPPQGLLRTSAA